MSIVLAKTSSNTNKQIVKKLANYKIGVITTEAFFCFVK